jgi:hypothetical protein
VGCSSEGFMCKGFGSGLPYILDRVFSFKLNTMMRSSSAGSRFLCV